MTDFDTRTALEQKLEEEARQQDQANAGGEAPPVAQQAVPYQPYQPARRKSMLQKWREKGGVLGGIATALIFLAKVGAPLFALLGKLKFLILFKGIFITFGSMVVSIWIMGKVYGLAYGIGIVALIFIHECGHAIAGMSKGIKPGFMLFVPFMGAFVTLSRFGKNLEQDAFIGIMGPVFGTLASLACVALAFLTNSPFFMALAYFGFFINLFNLLPTPPLDGGWIAPLFSPKLLAFGAVLMVIFGFRNPLILFLGIASIPRIIGAWKADPATQPYYQATTAARWKYGVAYIGLAGFLAAGMAVCASFAGR